MARLTLLEIVQDIMSDMDSDEVNSIDDTLESSQVAQIVKTTYFNIIDGRDWPHLYRFFQLTASGLTTRPTHMTIPEGVINVRYVKYNTKTLVGDKDLYTQMKYKTPEEFMDIVNKRDSTESIVDVVADATGISLNIYNERPPQYYTSFDNEVIIMDAYDSDLESTLVTSKTECYGKYYPTWTHTDAAYPDLPIQSFGYLLNEAKSTCFLVLKQQANQKAEQHSVTQRRRQSQEAWKVKNGITYPNYGRK